MSKGRTDQRTETEKGQDTFTENRKTQANHPDGTTEVLKVLFFHPSPSRLSPGRNTVFVPLNELCRVQQHPALGSLKRAWTITQSKKSSLGYKQRQRAKQQPKNREQANQTTNNTQKTKPKQQKGQKQPRSDGRALFVEIYFRDAKRSAFP